jgi:hypothetical protein
MPGGRSRSKRWAADQRVITDHMSPRTQPSSGVMRTEPQGTWEAPYPLLRVMQHRGAAFGFLPGFLPAQGGQVQQRIEAGGVLVAPPEGRIGVEHLAAVAQEAAVTRHLGGLLTAKQAWFGPVVVGQPPYSMVTRDNSMMIGNKRVGSLPVS